MKTGSVLVIALAAIIVAAGVIVVLNGQTGRTGSPSGGTTPLPAVEVRSY